MSDIIDERPALHHDGRETPRQPAESGSAANWEHSVLEKMTLELVREKRASRRWGIFFKLLGLAYLIGITGALLHAEGNLMHVLEGPPDAVDAVYNRVRRDSRHHGVLLLLETTVDERSFADWSIGFLSLEELPAEDRAAARSLYSLTEPGPGAVRRLMGTFRKLLPMQSHEPEADA